MWCCCIFSSRDEVYDVARLAGYYLTSITLSNRRRFSYLLSFIDDCPYCPQLEVFYAVTLGRSRALNLFLAAKFDIGFCSNFLLTCLRSIIIEFARNIIVEPIKSRV